MIGIPIPGESDTTYFESFSLAELDRTLGTLTRSLAVGAAVSTLAGALIGRTASRRVVAPLREVATAAEQIAQGDFRTRLDPRGDRDLAPLLHSFNDMAAAVSERLAREERFASDVSHELRTPLTALAAAASVLERRVTPETMPALEVLKAQINRFQRLVLDLLEISRYDAGAEHLERVAVEPGEFLRHVLTTSGRALSLLDLGAGLPARIAIDPRRVEQMLTNLMDNADLYGDGVVRVAVEVGSGMIRFTVDDEGQGVPVEEQERIFERFYRGSGRAAGDTGSGLGLALVAEHSRLHGGRVHVEDGPKGGARFVVELPVST